MFICSSPRRDAWDTVLKVSQSRETYGDLCLQHDAAKKRAFSVLETDKLPQNVLEQWRFYFDEYEQI